MPRLRPAGKPRVPTRPGKRGKKPNQKKKPRRKRATKRPSQA